MASGWFSRPPLSAYFIMAYSASGKRLGKRILTIAETHQAVASAIFISRSTTTRKLNGECGFTIRELDNLAVAFNVPVWWFFAPARLDPAEARELNRTMATMGTNANGPVAGKRQGRRKH